MAANPKEIRQQPFENERQAQEYMLAIVGMLQNEADDRVSKRGVIEKRWLEDLRQFHGQYEEKIEQNLEKAKKSTLFINQTRAKTNAMEARLSDMLFPTDDRNWGIEPTPVPELVVEAEEVAKRAAETVLAAQENEDDPQLTEAARAAEADLALVNARMDEAKKRARSMEAEIEDHLRECKYQVQARDVIKDACKIGTGVFKGPINGGHYKRSWRAQEDEQNVYQIVYEDDQRPMFWRVDPWNFFPDMDASDMAENEAVFERHLLNKKQLRRLARQPGFDEDAIRQLLLEDPRASTPTYLAQLRSITSAYNDYMTDRYHAWEYHGPIEAEDLEKIAMLTGNEDMLEDIGEEIDPLKELNVVIWFCQGKLLKFGIHHLDSGDPIYSVFNLEKDEATVFGFGIPFIMRDPQKSLSGAWRTLMDNMGLSSGPQIVINKDVIEPVNGEWVLEPRKLWWRTGEHTPDKKPFEIFNIDSHINDLIAVIELSKKNIDEETAMPMLAQGEQGAQVTKTFQGMAILMNSVNIVFRRIVKNWDDDVTTPNIRNLYDWLMQFSPKEHIKGDFSVDARGSSVLLVREMQSANLMAFILNFSGHPDLAKYLKDEGLPALRRLVQSMMIPADEVLKSEAEIKQDQARAAKMPPPPNPEMEKIAMQMNLERERGRNSMQIEGMKRETALIQLAATMNWDLEKLKAELDDKQRDRDSKERMMAVEAAVTQQQPPTEEHGGGHF